MTRAVARVDRLQQESPGVRCRAGHTQPLGFDAEKLGLVEVTAGIDAGERPHLVEKRAAQLGLPWHRWMSARSVPIMPAQIWLARSSSASALSSSATPSSSPSHARERPAAHRVRDAEELRMGDLGLERQRPVRCARVASASPLICRAHGSWVSGWARVAAWPRLSPSAIASCIWVTALTESPRNAKASAWSARAHTPGSWLPYRNDSWMVGFGR